MIDQKLAKAIKFVYSSYNDYKEEQKDNDEILSFSCWCEMNFNRAEAFEEWLEKKQNEIHQTPK